MEFGRWPPHLGRRVSLLKVPNEWNRTPVHSITLSVVEQFCWYSQWRSIHEFTKFNRLLYKQVDKDKLNVIGRPFMELRYMWLNSFVSKNLQQSTIHEFTKIDSLAIKTAR